MNSVHFSSCKQDYETPDELFAALDAEFVFTLDACANKENAKCVNYFDEEKDGLKSSWFPCSTVWCNPPYASGQLVKWVNKAIEEARRGVRVVMLVPARTETKWWHKLFPHAEEIRLLSGRLYFKNAPYNAPFPSCVVVLKRGSFTPNTSPRVICWNYRNVLHVTDVSSSVSVSTSP